MRFGCLILVLASLFASIDGANVKCTYPKSEGTGSHRIARYYYDKTAKECKAFWFKGVGGNLNNFADIKACHKTCICDLQLSKGIGQSKEDRYYYDSQSGTCKPFVYGGSGGNDNNFIELLECQRTCMDVCKLAPDNKNTINSCGVSCVTRYSYDSAAGTCVAVHFSVASHLNWNGNNFASKMECLQQCACDYQKNVQKASKTSDVTRWYLDGNAQECQLGIGNGNSNNRFATSYDCNGECVCFRPPVSGSGNQYSKKFFFNQITQDCEEFTYGGTGGNANRFNTREICIRKCGCNQPMDSGTGSDEIVRYYFDKNQGCKPFHFTGKGGNINRFGSLPRCARVCGVCDADVAPRPNAKSTHYYFDNKAKICKAYKAGHYGYSLNSFGTKDACTANCGCDLKRDQGYGHGRGVKKIYSRNDTGVCTSFRYRGNGGNANRFGSWDECKRICACGLPPQYGTGWWPSNRHYFDPVDKTCKTFRYSGYGGNSNKFWTESECTSTCT